MNGTINNYFIFNDNAFICTKDRLYMNYQDVNIGSLRRRVSCIDSKNNMFAIGVDNVLEVWEIPKEYKFTLFKNLSRNFIHSRKIISVKILEEKRILSISEDCSLCLFDLSSGDSKGMLICRDIPIGLHLIDRKIFVNCKNGDVEILEIDDWNKQSFNINNNIICSYSSGDMLAIIHKMIQLLTIQ